MIRRKRYLLACAALAASLVTAQQADSQKAFSPKAAPNLMAVLRAAQPFQDNDGQVPPPNVYSGPLFKLNHAWPTQAAPTLTDAPWRAAIGNGVLTPQNAPAYAAALKAAVAANGRNLIEHYDTWDAAKAGWYNEPWLGSLREAIHGTYGASTFNTVTFPDLKAEFQTHVVTYYDARAAASLNRFWGASAMKPTLQAANAQFDEGSIIVKAAAFASTDPKIPRDWWGPMAGAQVWNLYLDPTDNGGPPQLWPGYVAQFDIIVKDTQSSPQTGWVFMTLVYDNNPNIHGDIWDHMVVLGMQWGNDPQATSAGMPLKENWVNLATPAYSRATLGWGGRLSGPNDGAANLIAYNGHAQQGIQGDSGCMSCHSTAQWNVSAHHMDTFLLPSYPPPAGKKGPPFLACGADGKPDYPGGAYICSPAPGSAPWMKWFQNRKGTQGMDPDSFGTDFDEVFAFKTLEAWWAAVGPPGQAAPQLLRSPFGGGQRYNRYNGAPIPAKPAS